MLKKRYEFQCQEGSIRKLSGLKKSIIVEGGAPNWEEGMDLTLKEGPDGR